MHSKGRDLHGSAQQGQGRAKLCIARAGLSIAERSKGRAQLSTARAGLGRAKQGSAKARRSVDGTTNFVVISAELTVIEHQKE